LPNRLNPPIRPATEDDHEAAAEALALAFVDDPAWAHLLPDPEGRAERLLAFFTAEIGNLTPDYREVWVADDGSGAAIWGYPGRWRVPVSRTLRPAPQMAGVFGPRLPVAVWTLLRAERRHPRTPEHRYLQWLGVEPRHQGQGLGGALLAPVLASCDREAMPAYVEASSERSSALYARNGFTLTGTFRMPLAGPPIREMWREST
jgi:RimJ/RimL family protein N-acetyltransferase